jgi:hypothetical protein
MGSATTRRFALLAAILLLVPVWCRASVAHSAFDTHELAFIGPAATSPGSVPAIRRLTGDGWPRAGARLDHGRAVAALGLAGVLSLMGAAPWATLLAVRSAPPSLGRRRHVISLRAPPLLLAV